MRASRLLSILVLLQLQGRVTAEALAAEFEVSIRTIYRDIDELSGAGIPIQSDRGPHGGFQLMQGYRNPVTNLENKEAEALFMIGMPGPALALGLGSAANNASRKLLASLPPSLREESSQIAACFYLDTIDWYQADHTLPELPRIARAVLDQQCISLDYESWTGVRHWHMEPLGLVLKAGTWYLVAHSQSRINSPKVIRNFKVVNIRTLNIENTYFTRPNEFDLASYWQESIAQFEQQLRPLTAEIKTTRLGLNRIAALGAYANQAVEGALHDLNNQTFIDTEDRAIMLRLPIENIDQAARLLLGIGPEFEVIAPLDLRQRVRQLSIASAELNL